MACEGYQLCHVCQGKYSNRQNTLLSSLFIGFLYCLLLSKAGGVTTQCQIPDNKLSTGCPNGFAESTGECYLEENARHCQKQADSGVVQDPSNWLRTHLVLKLRPASHSTPGKTSGEGTTADGGDCVDMRFSFSLAQIGVGALLEETRTRRSGPEVPDEHNTFGVVEDTSSGHRHSSYRKTAGAKLGLEPKIRVLAASARHDQASLTVSHEQNYQQNTVIIHVQGATYSGRNTTKPIRVNLCVAYAPYTPSARTGEASVAKKESSPYMPPPMVAVVQGLKLMCSKCRVPTTRSILPTTVRIMTIKQVSEAVGSKASQRTPSQPTSVPARVIPTTHTVTERPTTRKATKENTTAFPTFSTSNSRSSFSKPTSSSRPVSVPGRTWNPAVADYTSSSQRPSFPASTPSSRHTTIKTDTLVTTPATGKAIAAQADDNDLSLFLTGNRLYVSMAAMAAIFILMLLVIIMLIALCRRRRRVYETSHKRRTLSPDVPSAFSTLVSSTNTTSTRISAPTPTKSKGLKQPLDFDLYPSATFPRVSALDSAGDGEDEDGDGMDRAHYHSSDICTTSNRRQQSLSDQNMSRLDSSNDDTSDVLFYTVSTKCVGNKPHTGYSALSTSTLERQHPYANNYSVPTGKSSKRGVESAKKTFKSKMSLSLEAVSGRKASSLPRSLGQTSGEDGNTSDHSNASDTFPQLPPSQRGSTTNRASFDGDASSEGWPDFSVFPPLGEDYAVLSPDIPAKKVSSVSS